MVDLFRFIEHDFAVPTAADPIEIVNQSDFQTGLTKIMSGEAPGEPARAFAIDYLTKQFEVPTNDPTTLGKPLAALAGVLRALKTISSATIRNAVLGTFGDTPAKVVASDGFAADLELLQNAALAVKLVTGLDRVNSTRLVDQLRAAALLQAFADREAAAPNRS
jgi:hypothetical protein